MTIISKFNPHIIEANRQRGRASMIAVIAPRGSGKSCLVRDILSYMKDIPMAFVFSGTERVNGFYSKHVHELCIYDDFDPEIVSQILNNQREIFERLKNKGFNPEEHPEEFAKRGIVIILDDLGHNKKTMHDGLLKELYYTSRHLSITVLTVVQYAVDIPPNCRNNLDFVFVLKENKTDNINKLYKYYFSIFENVNVFREALQKCTNNYKCLVIDNVIKKSGNIEEQIFWYKAELKHDYKIAEKDWKRWDKQLIKNKEYERSEKNIKLGGPKEIET